MLRRLTIRLLLLIVVLFALFIALALFGRWTRGGRSLAQVENQTRAAIDSGAQSIEPSTDMQLVYVDTEQYPDALCNDGTPAAYYERINPASDTWVIDLAGGGLCTDQVSCDAREVALPQFVTSGTLVPTVAWEGVHSDDPAVNPWHDANHVWIHYCSSDLWVGDAAASDANDGWHFRGQAILESVMSQLATTHSAEFSEATDMVMVGVSAGAIGVVNSADLLERLSPESADFHIIADSGVFFDIDEYADRNDLRDDIQTMFASGNTYWQSPGHPACVNANPDAPERCLFTEHLAPHVTQPVFYIRNLLDKTILRFYGPIFPLDADELNYTTDAALGAIDYFQRETADKDAWHLTCDPAGFHGYVLGTTEFDRFGRVKDGIVRWIDGGEAVRIAEPCASSS